MSKQNKKLVPQSIKALKAMKYEIATELGIIGGGSYDFSSEFADELGGQSQGASQHIDWGGLSSRQNGSIGGSMTKRLVQQAQSSIKGQL